MKHRQLFLLTLVIVFGCNRDDPQPADKTAIPIEDELLGNWEYQSAELYTEGGNVATLVWNRSETCEQSVNPLAWLIRQ